MYKVAVIILNWNGQSLLSQFLPSVVQYSNLPGVKIIVADNGSIDNSKEVVSSFETVAWLDLKKNHGFAGGYNLSIKEVEAEYVVLLNSDVEVSEGWLEPQINFLDNNPTVAASQPKILSWKEPTKFEYAGAVGGFIDYLGYPFCRGRIMNTLEEDRGQYNKTIPIFWATGAALMIRRSVYLEVGGLDERFFAHMEEIDLCWRVGARGYGIVAIPESKVFHVGGATLNKQNPKKTYLNFRNNLLMLYKNLPENKLKSVEQKRLVLDYIAIMFYLVKGECKNAKAVLRARKDYAHMKAEYAAIREENLEKTIQTPKGVVQKSIIYQYFIKRVKYFSSLI